MTLFCCSGILWTSLNVPRATSTTWTDATVVCVNVQSRHVNMYFFVCVSVYVCAWMFERAMLSPYTGFTNDTPVISGGTGKPMRVKHVGATSLRPPGSHTSAGPNPVTWHALHVYTHTHHTDTTHTYMHTFIHHSVLTHSHTHTRAHTRPFKKKNTKKKIARLKGGKKKKKKKKRKKCGGCSNKHIPSARVNL